MITCDALTDRMPDVAHGRATWTDDEARHIAACDECAATWKLVSAGTKLGRHAVVDVDAVALAVVHRLQQPDLTLVRPLARWRHVAIGLAAAAGIAFVVVPRAGDAPAPATAEVVPMVAVLPELGVLTEPELEQVLIVIEAGATDESAGVASPQMGDLTDDELERLLRSVEG